MKYLFHFNFVFVFLKNHTNLKYFSWNHLQKIPTGGGRADPQTYSGCVYCPKFVPFPAQKGGGSKTKIANQTFIVENIKWEGYCKPLPLLDPPLRVISLTKCGFQVYITDFLLYMCVLYNTHTCLFNFKMNVAQRN